MVHKVYTFNQGIENKFVRTLVFYDLNIIPVYGVAGTVDFYILNLIEFWTGSNPMAMQDGEVERQLITLEGTTYMVEATNKGFTAVLVGEAMSAASHLEFDAVEQTWTYRDVEQTQVLSSVKGLDQHENAVYELYADGSSQEVVVSREALEASM